MTCISVQSSILPTDRNEASSPGVSRPAAIVDRAAYALLLLAIATLLVRPADLLPSLEKQPIYECLIVACILASLPRLAAQLTLSSLRANGITVLVLMLVPAVMLSHLVHGNTYEARTGGFEIAKCCIFFLLVLCHINSFHRLRLLLSVVTAGVFVEASLSLLQYHGILHLEALATIAQRWHADDGGDGGVMNRLCGIGVFHDPNDFSLILVIAIVVCGYTICQVNGLWRRLMLLLPVALFGYALLLTHSRGGFTAAGGALLAFLAARYGWRNMVPLACVLLPILMVAFSGRQTHLDLNNPDDTFQARLGLWSESFDHFRAEPVFGVGEDKLRDLIGHVCHNSYLHAFTEMGLFGGIAFVGTFYLVLRGLWAAAPDQPDLARLRPFVLAAVAGYAVGLLSLSRCYTVPTQLILAIGTIFLILAGRKNHPAIPRLDGANTRRIVVAGLVVLSGCYLFMRLMIQRGGA
jgi:O-antigen ligase